MHGRPRIPCRFYGTAAGCRKGSSCTFLHAEKPTPTSRLGLNVARSYNSQASRITCSGGTGEAAGLIKDLLQQLAESLEPDLSKCQQWIQLSYRQLSRGNGSIVVNNLRRDDGTRFMTSVALQAGQQVRSQCTGHWQRACTSVMCAGTLGNMQLQDISLCKPMSPHNAGLYLHKCQVSY